MLKKFLSSTFPAPTDISVKAGCFHNDLLGVNAELNMEHENSIDSIILPPSQIINRFGFSRYIDFAMHLDIIYIEVHSKNYAPRKAKTTNNLGRRE